MFLHHLEIVQFKNHESLQFDFDHKYNFFIGKNGVGKTNILDAIYYLVNFRSHIHSIDSQNILHHKDFFRLRGVFDDHHEVVVKYAYRQKSIEVNQSKVTKYSDYFGHIPLVLASPADIFLLHDGSEERRKFLDYTISIFHKEYLQKLTEYHHYLDQRNAHLKQNETPDLSLIRHYNAHLVDLGNFIYEVRKSAVEELGLYIIQWYQEIASSDENVTIRYSSQLHETSLAVLLEANLSKDSILKRTSAGIHRDDISIEMHLLDLKKIASQGQQKSLLYAMRIAQAAYIADKLGQKPIFLLDDFSDKLDTQRKTRLLDLIQNIDFVEQWFISDTNKIEINSNYSAIFM